MTIRPSILVLLTFGVLMLVIAVEGRRLDAAADRAAAEGAALQRTRQTVDTIARRQATRQTVVERSEADTDLNERVMNALPDGASSRGARIRQIATTGDADVPDMGDGVIRKRQTASITIDGIGLPDVGGFLARWRDQNSAWHCDSINLQRSGGAGAGTTYALILQVSAIYIAGARPLDTAGAAETRP